MSGPKRAGRRVKTGATASHGNGSDVEAWLFVRSDVVPQRWRERADVVWMVPLLRGETVDILGGGTADPHIGREEEPLARLTAGGLPIEDIARELSLSPRSVQRRIASLRARLGVGSKDELALELARRGF